MSTNSKNRFGARRGLWALPTFTIGLAACVALSTDDPTNGVKGNGEPYEGIGSINVPLLAASCVAVTGGQSIVVADNETLYVTLRPSDNKVVVNAHATCELTTTQVLTVTATGTTSHTVILDYVNGLFMKGTQGALITMDFTNKSNNNTVKIRGSNGVDRFAFGAGGATGQALNVNSGTANTVPPGDAIVDVAWKNVNTLIVSTGPGADVVDCSGVTGTGTAYPTAVSIYGGVGDDILTGGLGADLIVGGEDADTMDGNDGNDTFYMGTAADGTDIITYASANTSNKTVDYHDRTNNLTLLINNTAASGEGSENDKIHDKIQTILAGAGDDTITLNASGSYPHIVKGGAGNDTITGGLGNDVIDGEGGDDTFIGDHCTADYSGRNVAVTVTLCTGSCAASNDDGDQTVTSYHNGTAGTAAAPNTTDAGTPTTADLTGLTGLTAGSVGRNIVITGGASAGTYPITAYTSATACTIDVSGNVNFAAVNGTLVWAESGHERDNVQCISVSGSLQGDTITGDSRANLIWGNAGADTITAGTGDDSLWGGAGADTLYGGVGADTLYGDAEDDTMYGGDDNDILTGGAGADTFDCNGNNSAGVAGTHAGDSDFTVDYTAAESDTKTHCAF